MSMPFLVSAGSTWAKEAKDQISLKDTWLGDGKVVLY